MQVLFGTVKLVFDWHGSNVVSEDISVEIKLADVFVEPIDLFG